MQYLYYLVRERWFRKAQGDLIEVQDNPAVAVTVFAYFDNPPTYCSLPSGKEGLLDTINYEFEPLTLAQFETYIEFNMFPNEDSDKYVLPPDGVPEP